VRHPLWVIFAAVIAMAATVPVALRLESELMPPLDEGSLLYMPTSPPGMSIGAARDALVQLDARLKQFPEVESVFGKMGRAETATDPAPIGMAEIVIVLKDKSRWRAGLTREALVQEMDRAVQMPGMPNIWWMPIQTRTEMLATGVRSPLAVQVKGSAQADAATLEHAASQVADVLRRIPGARSIVAERLLGATALDVDVDREAAARVGLSVKQVHEVLSAAVGGVRTAEVIRGRERLGVRVRVARELRDDPEEIMDLTLSAPGGVVRLGDVASVRLAAVPDMVKSEDGALLATVFIDTDRPIDAFATDAERAFAKLTLPAGVRLEWAGQIEHLRDANDRLLLVVPVVLLVIVLLLYLSTRSVVQTCIVLLAVPFSLIGAVWFLWWWSANLSVAVWVGFIALLGLDAETGVVMLLYLTLAHDRAAAEHRLTSRAALDAVVVEGAARRLRPKLMTVATTAIGLLPLLWSGGVGADVMKPIALPLVGGLASSFLLELLVYPALFVLWKRRSLAAPLPR
jgi:Cu(I)/Ag(I) efflux system membrane protein CusA/SilA